MLFGVLFMTVKNWRQTFKKMETVRYRVRYRVLRSLVGIL